MKLIKLIKTKNKQQNFFDNDEIVDDENNQIVLIKTILKTLVFNNYCINIDFCFINNFIYYLFENNHELIKSRLCISFNAIHNVFKLTHNNCFYIDYYRVYTKLIEFVYIHKLFRKLTIYIQYCFFLST